MRLNEVDFRNALPVDGYGPGFFRIGGTAYPAPLAVIGSGVVEWRGLEDAGMLLTAAGVADIVLIGTGPEMVQIPAVLRRALEEVGLGIEIMASPQACRTYNVLLGEGRRVALALLPV